MSREHREPLWRDGFVAVRGHVCPSAHLYAQFQGEGLSWRDDHRASRGTPITPESPMGRRNRQCSWAKCKFTQWCRKFTT